MKIFWSWRSLTAGKIGRHFVRDALTEAIKVLKQPNEIEGPSDASAARQSSLTMIAKAYPEART